jgi:hypothetical protein
MMGRIARRSDAAQRWEMTFQLAPKIDPVEIRERPASRCDFICAAGAIGSVQGITNCGKTPLTLKMREKRAERVAKAGNVPELFQFQLLQGLKPNIDLIDSIGPAKVRP